MTAVLYRWPSASKFGRVVPKGKFYEHGGVSPAVREKFVTEVERITWAYKLADETINLPGSKAVPEIQVFIIEAKTSDAGVANVSDAVMASIDRAIKQPVIFEVTGLHGTRMTATPKQIGLGTPKLGAYYSTVWMPVDANREPLPTAINLAALYAALLNPLTSVTVRPGEEVSGVAARLEAVRRLEREVALLERKLRAEPQINRKVELRRKLKDRQAALASLM